MTREEAFDKFKTLLWERGRDLGFGLTDAEFIKWKGDLHAAAVDYAHAAALEVAREIRGIIGEGRK